MGTRKRRHGRRRERGDSWEVNARDQKCNLRRSTCWRRRGRLPLLRTEAPHSRAPLLASERVRNRVRQNLVLRQVLLALMATNLVPSIRSFRWQTLPRTSRTSKRRWTVPVASNNLLRRQTLQLSKGIARQTRRRRKCHLSRTEWRGLAVR